MHRPRSLVQSVTPLAMQGGVSSRFCLTTTAATSRLAGMPIPPHTPHLIATQQLDASPPTEPP